MVGDVTLEGQATQDWCEKLDWDVKQDVNVILEGSAMQHEGVVLEGYMGSDECVVL